MMRKPAFAALVIGVLVAAALACPTAASESNGVFTLFRVLVGKASVPEAGGAAVLILPGTVVMVGRSPEQEAKDVLELMGRLKEDYRLGEITLAGSFARLMPTRTDIAIPGVGEGLEVEARLLASDDQVATYSIAVKEHGAVISNPKISVRRGDRGIVGTGGGAGAPYFFLTVEPLGPVTPPTAPERGAVKGAVTEPKLATKVSPVYPEEARKAHMDGVVILACTIGRDGGVREAKPVRSEPMGLTEAAVDAVKQWRYEPAKDAAGNAVEVTLTVTVSFLLDRSKPNAPKS